MTFFDPRKWNTACWLLLLLWLYPSVLMNTPIEPNLEGWESNGQLADGSRFAAYDPTFLIGWPFCYLEIATNGSNPSVRSYTPINAMLNFLLVTTTIVSLIYAAQKWVPRFSIRTMLIGVAAVAAIITIGQAVFATEYYAMQTGFMMAV